ncbi:EAL domain-containing protein [Hellea balneolensis]|uniref:EAL domain-containing protein n=1 Tax=Hellea balneolensis TaxID=287478 RepID=UPI0004027B20|nr:EAL domain-containing protein [Hellea balneolensis]
MVDILTADGFRAHISEQLYKVMRQPIVDLNDGRIHHYEWLVRFDDETETQGVIRPAELSGVIRDLDLSMLAQAILVLNADPSGAGIAINLSGASVDKAAFKGSVLACLTAFEASPTKLIIELTESWDMHDLALAESLLTELKTRGHPVCLDDVGAGAASIRYLRALPANWLKIDGGFVAAAFNSTRDRAILEALLSLREALDVRFIAEGVETEEIKTFVKNLGFDAAQGYAIGRPELETRI